MAFFFLSCFQFLYYQKKNDFTNLIHFYFNLLSRERIIQNLPENWKKDIYHRKTEHELQYGTSCYFTSARHSALKSEIKCNLFAIKAKINFF